MRPGRETSGPHCDDGCDDAKDDRDGDGRDSSYRSDLYVQKALFEYVVKTKKPSSDRYLPKRSFRNTLCLQLSLQILYSVLAHTGHPIPAAPRYFGAVALAAAE